MKDDLNPLEQSMIIQPPALPSGSKTRIVEFDKEREA